MGCAFAEECFARLESRSRQVTGSTRISRRRRMVIKATTGPLKNLHSTTMKEVSAWDFESMTCVAPRRLVKWVSVVKKGPG